MSLRFRVGTHRPTNLYVQVGDLPSELDPQVGFVLEGWATALVDQANWVHLHSCAPPLLSGGITTAGELKHRTDLDQWEWLGASGTWRRDWPPPGRWVDDYPVRVRRLVDTKETRA